jgi:hypothetical protein
MHFQIYLPDRRGADLDHLRAAGLGELLRPDDQQPACQDLVGEGPDGRLGGQLWSWLTPGAQAWGLGPGQTWIAGAGYWIGWPTDAPPTPDDLLRARPIDGRTLTLRDGHAWLVPQAQRVPQVVEFRAGQWEVRPDPQYARLIDSALWATQACLDFLRAGRPLDLRAAAEHALAALQWNYRLTGEVASRLFSSENLLLILAVYSDFEKIREAAQQLGAFPPPTPPS